MNLQYVLGLIAKKRKEIETFTYGPNDVGYIGEYKTTGVESAPKTNGIDL